MLSRPTIATTASRPGRCAIGWKTLRDALIARRAPTSTARCREAAKPAKSFSDWQQKIAALIAAPDPRCAGRSVRAHGGTAGAVAARLLLDWHRREEKAAWWEYFRLSRSLGRRSARRARRPFWPDICWVSRRNCESANPSLQLSSAGNRSARRRGLTQPGRRRDLARSYAISLENRTVDIKKRQDTAGFHPRRRFRPQVVRPRSWRRAGAHWRICCRPTA